MAGMALRFRRKHYIGMAVAAALLSGVFCLDGNARGIIHASVFTGVVGATFLVMLVELAKAED